MLYTNSPVPKCRIFEFLSKYITRLISKSLKNALSESDSPMIRARILLKFPTCFCSPGCSSLTYSKLSMNFFWLCSRATTSTLSLICRSSFLSICLKLYSSPRIWYCFVCFSLLYYECLQGIL